MNAACFCMACAGWAHFDAIWLGSAILGFASAALVIFPASLAAVVVWEILITIGDSLVTARVYALAASLAPAGMEATFVALGGVPAFLSMFPSGWLSGWLLATHVPTCPAATDFSGERFCSLRANLLNGSAACFSAACLPTSTPPPPPGFPCVCGIFSTSRCHTLCPTVVPRSMGTLATFGQQQQQQAEQADCPTVCADMPGVKWDGRALWLRVLCISAAGPILITALHPLLRPPDAPPICATPVRWLRCCGNFKHRGTIGTEQYQALASVEEEHRDSGGRKAAHD